MAAKIIGALIVFLGGAAIVALLVILYGIVFQFLWNYVAQVYWAQAPQITLLQAIATTALISTIVGPLKRSSKK